MALVAPLVATLIQPGILRSREYLADETCVLLAGEPAGLADALERHARKAITTSAGVQPATSSLFVVNSLAGAGGLLNLCRRIHPCKSEFAGWEPCETRAGSPRIGR